MLNLRFKNLFILVCVVLSANLFASNSKKFQFRNQISKLTKSAHEVAMLGEKSIGACSALESSGKSLEPLVKLMNSDWEVLNRLASSVKNIDNDCKDKGPNLLNSITIGRLASKKSLAKIDQSLESGFSIAKTCKTAAHAKQIEAAFATANAEGQKQNSTLLEVKLKSQAYRDLYANYLASLPSKPQMEILVGKMKANAKLAIKLRMNFQERNSEVAGLNKVFEKKRADLLNKVAAMEEKYKSIFPEEMQNTGASIVKNIEGLGCSQNLVESAKREVAQKAAKISDLQSKGEGLLTNASTAHCAALKKPDDSVEKIAEDNKNKSKVLIYAARGLPDHAKDCYQFGAIREKVQQSIADSQDARKAFDKMKINEQALIGKIEKGPGIRAQEIAKQEVQKKTADTAARGLSGSIAPLPNPDK